MDIRNIPLKQLKLWGKNARSVSAPRFQALKASIERLGLLTPLIVTEDYTVLAGNMRLRALLELDYTEAPCSVISAGTLKKMADVSLTDNQTFGYYNPDQLGALLAEAELTEEEMDMYELHVGGTTPLREVLEFHRDKMVQDEKFLAEQKANKIAQAKAEFEEKYGKKDKKVITIPKKK